MTYISVLQLVTMDQELQKFIKKEMRKKVKSYVLILFCFWVRICVAAVLTVLNNKQSILIK